MGLGGSDEGGTSGFFKEPRNGRRRTCCPSNLLISIFYQLPSDKSNTMCYQRRETVKKKKQTKIMASGPSASQQIDQGPEPALYHDIVSPSGLAVHALPDALLL